ncbi:hypothetical protein DFH08DRAFT_1051250 [Mycena albidolilacea]|uniref:Uncharacterized protein n=1 Tax=Mycena albidolilacea TaxID=1033008 RepID=A0AAD6Z689_9AGAR|nr:hypothetical protein DFH08DRAFT_1051250 [Mycena albidolilacea]
MVKLGFSASALLFTFFSNSVAAAALVRQSESLVYGRAGVNVTGISNSTSTQTCAVECAQPAAVLAKSCAGVNSLSLVPCGCTDVYSTAQEACSRCRLPLSGTPSLLAQNTFNEKKNFGDFQRACATAGKPIKDINLDDVNLVIRHPFNVTLETPSTIGDEFFADYISAVCLNPEQITLAQCGVGGVSWVRCPNSDVSGILVRFSAYMANLLLGIVLMYSPAESSTAVWTQLLTVYSLLISGLIAIGQGSLSRFHSGMTIFLVMSPLSTTLVVYAILGFCGRSHRLDIILSKRREHLIPRLLVILFALISMAIVIFTSAANASHFAISPCESDDFYRTFSGVILNFLFVPYAGVVLLLVTLQSVAAVGAVFAATMFFLLLPFILLVGSLVYALVKQRHVLAKQFHVQNNRWKIWVAWDVIAVQYPLLHFCGVFFVPMAYWILVNEIRTVGTPDNIFSSSFGQILALFVVLPPLIQVVQMAPFAREWFMNTTFIRFVTGRRGQVPPPPKALSLEDGVLEKAVDPFQDPVPESYQVHNAPAATPSYMHGRF